MSTATKYSDICIKCGICCDGTAFDNVNVETTDLNTATEGKVSKGMKGQLQIKHPCTAHSNNICTIYSQRPAMCRTYECKLLKLFKLGKVTENTAYEVIDNARSAANEINSLLENAGIPKNNRSIQERMGILEKEALTKLTLRDYRKEHGPLLIKFKLFQELLYQKFGVGSRKLN